jgi:hypothetical protein
MQNMENKCSGIIKKNTPKFGSPPAIKLKNMLAINTIRNKI